MKEIVNQHTPEGCHAGRTDNQRLCQERPPSVEMLKWSAEEIKYHSLLRDDCQPTTEEGNNNRSNQDCRHKKLITWYWRFVLPTNYGNVLANVKK